MKNFLLFLVFIIFSSCSSIRSVSELNLSVEDKINLYIKKYAPAATKNMRFYKIPASITLAQGILESGAGKGRLAVEANNHFGIKCHDWNGKNVLLFGSEGFGIKLKTLEKSDFKFKVDINKSIESLNISNTVSIVCHHVFQTLKNK